MRRKICLPELGCNFTFENVSDKIEHEGIGTFAGIEISQLDENNADQKVKWFLKVSKNTNFCGKHIIDYLFSQVCIHFHILLIFYSRLPPPPPPPKMKLLLKINKNNSLFHPFDAFPTTLPCKFQLCVCYR